MVKQQPAGICDDCHGAIVGRGPGAETCLACKDTRDQASRTKYRTDNRAKRTAAQARRRGRISKEAT